MNVQVDSHVNPCSQRNKNSTRALQLSIAYQGLIQWKKTLSIQHLPSLAETLPCYRQNPSPDIPYTEVSAILQTITSRTFSWIKPSWILQNAYCILSYWGVFFYIYLKISRNTNITDKASRDQIRQDMVASRQEGVSWFSKIPHMH